MSNQSTSVGSMLEEIKDGLGQSSKKLPSKLFYDEEGSRLFEQITMLEEYYLTRAEIEILEDNIEEIADAIGSDVMLVELGSGSSKKTRLLLGHLSNLSAYVPVDISEEYLIKVISRLRMDYPCTSIIPIFADYTNHFKLPNLGGDYERQVIFFPGSTIGNFRPEEARSFFDNLYSLTDENSGMLVGVDMKKDKQVLEAAYNDSEGLTAEFNKNMLARLNRDFRAYFDLNNFSHRAFYNEDEGRIEMHLVSQTEQSVTIDGEQFYFEEGESIHTENSYKYTLGEFEELVSNWYTVEEVWTDEQDYFSVQYLSRK